MLKKINFVLARNFGQSALLLNILLIQLMGSGLFQRRQCFHGKKSNIYLRTGYWMMDLNY